MPPFTIIVTEANGLLRPIHERMLMILALEGCDRWLDPEAADGHALLRPCSPSGCRLTP